MNKRKIIKVLAKEYNRVVVVSASEHDSRFMKDLCQDLDLSNVHFSTISNFDRIRGLRPDCVVFDDYQEIPQDLMEVIVHGFAATSRSPTGKPHKTTPVPSAIIYLG